MIHSMSGGVIKKYATKTLVKVRFDDTVKWYECSVPAFVGDNATAEVDGVEKTGKVEEVLLQVTADKAPVPFPLLKEVIRVFEDEM